MHADNLGDIFAFASSEGGQDKGDPHSAEEFTKTWVGTALTVRNGLLTDADIKHSLLQAQDTFGKNKTVGLREPV